MGFPDNKVDLPPSLRKYWGSRSHLSVEDGLIVYGCQLFIPTTFCSTILANFTRPIKASPNRRTGLDKRSTGLALTTTLRHTLATASSARIPSHHIRVS